MATTFIPKVQSVSVALPDVNPFLFGSAVPENLFVGRKSAINDVRNRIGTVNLQSLSIVAKELMEDALEKHEDMLLSELAMKREAKSKKVISHEKAWK